MTMISIIIPSYNRAQLISIGIQSIIDQTYQNWELIIIDDGSTDRTEEVIRSFNDIRIRYIYQVNAERSAARNNGIRNAKGEWICFLDSDDEYLPNHLELLINYIQEFNLMTGLIITGLKTCSQTKITNKPFLNLSNPSIFEEIWTKFILPTQTCTHNTILKSNKFDERFRLWEDTHLWLRITSNHTIYQIEEYSAIQNIHNEGTVVQGMKDIKMKDVRQYIKAILDLKENYSEIFKGKLTDKQINEYVDNKYQMYLYQARQNKQFKVATRVFFKAFSHHPSIYLLKEFFKIPLNFVNIGIHEKVS